MIMTFGDGARGCNDSTHYRLAPRKATGSVHVRDRARRIVLTVAMLGGLAMPADAGTITVNWTPDGTQDGSAVGTLNGVVPVTLSSTNGPSFGGVTLGADPWAANPSTDSVPGIGGPGVVNNEAMIDWS